MAPQALDKGGIKRHRHVAKANQVRHAPGRAHRAKVVHPGLQADEQIIRKQRLFHHHRPAAAKLLDLQPRVKDAIALPLQVQARRG